VQAKLTADLTACIIVSPWNKSSRPSHRYAAHAIPQLRDLQATVQQSIAFRTSTNRNFGNCKLLFFNDWRHNGFQHFLNRIICGKAQRVGAAARRGD